MKLAYDWIATSAAPRRDDVIARPIGPWRSRKCLDGPFPIKHPVHGRCAVPASREQEARNVEILQRFPDLTAGRCAPKPSPRRASKWPCMACQACRYFLHTEPEKRQACTDKKCNVLYSMNKKIMARYMLMIC
ncbi:MAG: hypothetical protein MUC79_07415 [Thiobacillaceae bacterium]|nr:hypothetical protein [Thiobacillaceae bacterium]